MVEDIKELANPLQRTSQWFADRCGCLTGSRASKVFEVSKRDGKPLKGYTDLIETLIAERATGECESTFNSAAMQWGSDHEAEARGYYELKTGNLVDLVGFVRHDTIPFFGASPDGLVGDDGLVEIKCPNTTTHLKRIREGKVPEEYKPQMLVQLIVTGRKWCDFVDYDPRVLDERLRYFCVRFEPTEEERKETLEKCKAFLDEVDAEYRALLQTVGAYKEPADDPDDTDGESPVTDLWVAEDEEIPF